MISIVLVHLLLGCALVLAGDRVGRSGFLIAALAPLSSLIWLVSASPSIIGGEVRTWRVDWVPSLGLAIEFRADALSLVMLWLVAGVGLLVCLYSYRYFSASKPALGRLSGLLVLFAGSMTGLLIADHLLALFIFWELTSVTSYLLIGNDDRNPRARDAALSAITITGAGGLVLLAGLVLLGQQSGTYRLSELVVDSWLSSVSWVAALLILLGAFTKSAQFPFSSWLPGAMVAPTPISTYLHAATMVKAGVYLVARLAPALAEISIWRPIVFALGSITMMFGGWRALRQVDLKLLLAHGTVSQLGLLVVLFGAGDSSMAQAGVVLLLAHAIFKAALFMVVGILDHQAGTRDVRRLPRLGPGWAPIQVTTLLAAASMAGVPPMVGFIGKEKILGASAEGEFPGAAMVTAAIVLGSIVTFAYSSRFALGVLGKLTRADGDVEPVESPVAPPSRLLAAPAILLGAASLLIGVAPRVISSLVESATANLHPDASPKNVALWAGFNIAFALSIVVIVVGAVVSLCHRWIGDMQRRFHRLIEPLPSADSVFWKLLGSLLQFAKRTTRIVQNGSLPVYVMVVLGVGMAAVAVPALGSLDGFPDLVHSPAQLAPLSFVIVAALGAAWAKKRISAALLLGGAGYGMAGLYVINGAPDLALTQFAIETLATVLFVLVLRALPRDFEVVKGGIRSSIRLLIAILVGAGVFIFALVAADSRESVNRESISEEMIERSVPDAFGSNVVNVILVDFRGMDTLGEITVLAVAALGTVALARGIGRHRTMVDGPTIARSQIVDAITRLLFASIAVLATYFLFAGHNQPGGGFVGGLTVGAAISLRYVAGGVDAVRRSVRIPANVILGSGLGLALLTAFVPLALGGSVLEHAALSLDVPVLGTIKTTSALLFDTGVFFVVIGLVMMAIEAFGGEPELEEDRVLDDARIGGSS